MSYELLIFQSAEERSTCHACSGHKWENQDNIFGKETEKLLATCKHLFRVSIDLEPGDEAKLLKKRLTEFISCGMAWVALSNRTNFLFPAEAMTDSDLSSSNKS